MQMDVLSSSHFRIRDSFILIIQHLIGDIVSGRNSLLDI